MHRWALAFALSSALSCQGQITQPPVGPAEPTCVNPEPAESTPAPAAPTPAPAAPTPAPAEPTESEPVSAHCLDPRTDGLRRWQAAGEHWIGSSELQTEQTADWDGDDSPELLVASSTLCGATGNCPYLAYLSHEGCWTYAGQVNGVSIEPTPARHHGVSELVAYWKGGCVGTEGSFVVYQYDGREFHASDAVNCECIDELHPPEPDRDPRCPE